MKGARFWLLLVLVVLLVTGLARLRFDVEVLHLLPEEIPAVRGLVAYQKNFSDTKELIVTLSSDDATVTEGAAQSLASHLRAATNLVEDVFWQPPWLENPLEGSELLAHAWLNQPPARMRELAARLTPEQMRKDFAATRERLATSLSPEDLGRLSYDPLRLTDIPGLSVDPTQGSDFFASPDGKFRILMVEAKGELRSYPAAKRWLKQVEETVSAWQAANPDFKSVQWHRTGSPAFVSEIAGGMESDMRSSVVSTLILIAILFRVAHRRWKPLLWLLALLGLILLCTLAVGGLLFGKLNVVTIGFAAILLGLAVDYAAVIYQEACGHPFGSARELRRAQTAPVLWAAITTGGAFAVLNFSGLPGLAQLGSLVAIGIAIAAVVMLTFYPAVAIRNATPVPSTPPVGAGSSYFDNPVAMRRTGIVLTLVLLAGSAGWLLKGLPGLDHSASPLRPLKSPAYDALEEIQSRLARTANPLWVLVSGADEAAVATRLDDVQRSLNSLQADDDIAGFSSARTFWPQPENRRFNVPLGLQLSSIGNDIREAAAAEGFSTNAIASTLAMLDSWKRSGEAPKSMWPTNRTARWATAKLSAKTPEGWLALVFVTPKPGQTVEETGRTLSTALPGDGVLVAGWDLLGDSLLGMVKQDLWKVLLPMGVILITSLWLAFRRWSEVLLSLATLAFSGIGLLAVMKLFGWSWNLLNLMALPLLLGACVDFSIHLQLSLRKYGGAWRPVWNTTGKALVLSALTNVAGFASLAWTGNAGLASLDKLCAVGILLALFTGLVLLPSWWLVFAGATVPKTAATKPSQLYQARTWKLACAVIRVLPLTATRILGRIAGLFYRLAKTDRLECVTQNLLPICNGDLPKAQDTARRVFSNFGEKLVDLWRFEAGADIQSLFTEFKGWEHYAKAKAEGRGVLLVTPHLGNWEFGGPLMTQRGEKLLVLTLPEPGTGFTEMRQAARARWGIETLVVGENPFAFVEVIQRLQSGANVALLLDRPPV
ncbi:MAG TPA: MMPL family transporter, partial [Roseimicrobium sp.]|nr:MMPL family transporter [Roseimicrobium sp.]